MGSVGNFVVELGYKSPGSSLLQKKTKKSGLDLSQSQIPFVEKALEFGLWGATWPPSGLTLELMDGQSSTSSCVACYW